jgi:hypothetical protein
MREGHGYLNIGFDRAVKGNEDRFIRLAKLGGEQPALL